MLSLCSCHRDGKSQHTEACRAAHRRYKRSVAGVLNNIRHKIREFEKETGVKL